MLLDGDDIRDVFEAMLPENALRDIIDAAQFQERRRRLDALRLVRAMIIAASTGYGGRQADVMRLYFKSGAPRVVRGGFYAWFGSGLDKTLKAVVERAIEIVRRQPLDLPPLLAAHVRDWHIVDSSTVRLHDALREEFPGTGEYAALKVHKRLSVGIGCVYDFHLSAARDHDAPHLQIDESWRGLGLLVDLGYASLKLIEDCTRHEVHFVMRLKENWKPKVDILTRGQISGTFFAGTDLDALLDDDVLLLSGRVIDAQVVLGRGTRQVRCRLVGVPGPDAAYRFYLTSLPTSVGPHQIADIYRVRWEIESDNKLDKSCNHLDQIQAQTAPAVRALVHASLVSSMLTALVAHKHRLAEGTRNRPTPRTVPPLHPQALARAMGSAAQDIAATFEREGDDARRSWQQLAEYLQHLAEDPNWRRSPSILDQMRGWRISPGRPRTARLASPTRRSAN